MDYSRVAYLNLYVEILTSVISKLILRKADLSLHILRDIFLFLKLKKKMRILTNGKRNPNEIIEIWQRLPESGNAALFWREEL